MYHLTCNLQAGRVTASTSIPVLHDIINVAKTEEEKHKRAILEQQRFSCMTIRQDP